jgi:iron complex outermembrane receptor protein/vitamin B12 transporter
VEISEVDIERRAAASLMDVLRMTPMLHLDQVGAPGGFSALYLRGADPNHTAVMIDGVKVADPTNARGGGIDLSLIDPRTIARIEIMPGASSAIYGADAMAGVVNIITHQPARTGVRVGGGIGGQGYARGFASGSAVGHGVGLHASIAASQDGRSSDTAFARSGTGSLRLNAGNGPHRLTAWIRAQHREGNAFPEDSGGAQYAVTRELERRHTDGAVAAIDAETATAWGAVRLYSNVFHQDTDVRSPGVAPGVRDPFGIPRSVSSSHYRRWAGGAVVVFGSGPEAPALVGAQYEKEQGDVASTLFFGPFTLPANFALERSTRSAFTEGRVRITEALTAQAGLRADDTDAHGTRITMQAGLRYRPTQVSPTLALNYGTGFKPPSFFALGHPLVGNPQLEPEESRTVEVSLASDLNRAIPRSIGYRVALFRSRYENLVDFDSGPPPRLVNRSEVEIKGYDVAAVALPIPKLNVRAAVTGLTFELPPGTPALRSRPRFRATAAAAYEIAPQLTGTVYGSAVSRVFDSSIPTGAVYLSPYFLLDASLAYAAHGWRAVIAIDNVLDREYQQFVGFPARGRRARLELSFDI